MKIGVFDSGVGGKSVVNAIHKALPELEIIYAEDRENLPYGNKTSEQLYRLVLPVLNDLAEQGCRIIVIACNTVTTNIITRLREEISVPLIGMEPMIKPAAEITKSKIITVCATPSTLASKRYEWLKETYAQGVDILEPDCSDWAELIETDQADRSHIHNQIEDACNQGADVIVLGCTHYHWIEDIISQEVAGRAIVLQPENPVIEQLRRVLEQLA